VTEVIEPIEQCDHVRRTKRFIRLHKRDSTAASEGQVSIGWLETAPGDILPGIFYV